MDAPFGEPGNGSFEEPYTGHGFLVGKHFDVRDTAGVIDTHVHCFPTGITTVVSGAPAGDSVSWLVEPAEFLDVDVDQLAWMASAVSVWWFWRLEL